MSVETWIQQSSKSDVFADIFPDGDVVLVVGPQNVRLRVYSQCLCCASKVFSAMLGPRWSEAQGLSKESPREVPLVEDDADALRTICCVIHHRNDDLPQSLTPREVLQITIEADKYDLNVALKFASVEWLKPRSDTDRVNMGYLLAAAFLYGDMDIFVAHSLVLILYYKGSYLEFLDDEITSQIVPWKTFYLLEERRTRMRAELGQFLTDGKNTRCSCGWGKEFDGKYGLLLSKYGPLKMLEVPILDIVNNIEKVSSEHIERGWHSGYGSNDSYYHEASSHSEKVTRKLETMKKKAGICFDCVRSGDAATPCRFQHE